jgi:chromate transport protein ChrA
MSPGLRRDLIASVAGAVCIAAYIMWAGGEYRYNHWFDGTIWGLAAAVGLISAFAGLRLAQDAKETFLSIGLLCFHCLSLLLLLLMISLIGARP